MTAMLVFGLLLGMRHALDADHLAAVATLVSRHNRPGDALRQGVAWGIGHTLTLLLFGSLVIWMDSMIPEQLARGLELLVGLMLVVLGLDVLRRMYRDRIHVHIHRHGEQRHLHLHSHRGESGVAHEPDHHHHPHPASLPLRALFIGIMHGLAGSAALILLTLETVGSPWLGMAYMGLFGIGSIIGMALLSLVMAIPLRQSARGLGWFHHGLPLVVGAASVFLGIHLVMDIVTAGPIV
jgi:cytochrome c biogenesis protein CcdA